MANGSRGKGGGRRSEETRAGSLDEDERKYARRSRSNETRIAPVEDEEPETLPPPSAGESNRTMFASHAALFADRLRERFAQKRYGRAPHHRMLRIDEPEGPSTAGGRLARQPLSLVTRSGTAPTLVCGWVDVAREEAQLRGYESVARRYEAHHGTPLDLAAQDYERCLEDLEVALRSGGIRVRVIIPDDPVPARKSAPSPTATAPQGLPLGWGAVAITVAFLLGLLVGRWSG
ncbi:hypothetical protein [Cystobacter ferrugineus]|uniref:Uncharacterized protein n=1 Tax=Cystobacter ferrugineus TaxID=83449 RepID=A0A1L9BCV4_9BACT|nr:hypothetical protein [Cystobacter ferrugineus]OJH40085.1 hypothetical protein BON30_13570 [Cystobacter ferrugineus]